MFEEIVTKDGLKFNGLEKKIYKKKLREVTNSSEKSICLTSDTYKF